LTDDRFLAAQPLPPTHLRELGLTDQRGRSTDAPEAPPLPSGVIVDGPPAGC